MHDYIFCSFSQLSQLMLVKNCWAEYSFTNLNLTIQLSLSQYKHTSAGHSVRIALTTVVMVPWDDHVNHYHTSTLGIYLTLAKCSTWLRRSLFIFIPTSVFLFNFTSLPHLGDRDVSSFHVCFCICCCIWMRVVIVWVFAWVTQSLSSRTLFLSC